VYNRLLNEAARLSGNARERAYGELDIRLSRDAAPAIPWATLNSIDFVSPESRLRLLQPALRPHRDLSQVTRALAATA